jgi:hypothetical protein
MREKEQSYLRILPHFLKTQRSTWNEILYE